MRFTKLIAFATVRELVARPKSRREPKPAAGIAAFELAVALLTLALIVAVGEGVPTALVNAWVRSHDLSSLVVQMPAHQASDGAAPGSPVDKL